MSMFLTLARVDADLLAAIRLEPSRLDRILDGDDPGVELFAADYRTLDAISAVTESRDWFDQATGGTDTVDYDMTYRPVFVLSPYQVTEIAAGLAAEGWGAGPDPVAQTGETDADVDRSARALGEAADWDPDEIEAYGPMMAATGSGDFNVRCAHHRSRGLIGRDSRVGNVRDQGRRVRSRWLLRRGRPIRPSDRRRHQLTDGPIVLFGP